MAMDSLISKLVNTLTGDKVAQQGKDYWVDDAKCKACYECETPFSVFVRRHHCRICGRIFCSSCTFNSIPASRDAAVLASGEQAWLRVCNYCHRMRQRDDDGSERQQPDAAGQLLLGATHTSSSSRLRSDEPGAVTSSSGSTRTGNSSPTGKLQHAFLQRSSSSSSGSDGSLTWEVPPVLQRTFGPTAEAVAEEVAAPAADSDAAAPAAGAAVSGDGEAAVTSSSNSSSRPLSPSSQPLNNTSGIHPVVLLNRREFARAADEHLQQLLWQLLQAEDVQQPDMWLPIVLRLVCEASRALLPAAAAAFGEQDPRFYVKVKRLPDMGSPADCRVVRGVAAKKNVAHRRMRTDIPQPAVVLLSGALEYQRVANRLSSFDTLLEQEREHLRLAVARIAACKPDLLLVERSVARSAQEELLQRGISLVQHTKPELLERLGRCMGVKVAASLEELSPQLVGSCSRFKVEQLPSAPVLIQQQPAAANGSAVHEAAQHLATSAAAAQAQPAGSFSNSSLTAAIALGDAGGAAPSVVVNTAAAGTAGAKPAPVSATPAPAKTLMLFDGCPLPLGCTVLLWGASAAELTKLKRVVRFGVLAAYHQGLECSFLAEELALATAALAMPGISRDAALYRSLARAAISSSREATNPCGLQSERRLLLSLSPHVVVPDALEKEQQHDCALLAQQQHEEGMQHQKQQQQHAQVAELIDAAEQQQQQEQQSDALSASMQQAAGAAATPTSPVADGQQQQQAAADEAAAEPEFTDPLRRRTLPGEGVLLSEDEEEQQQHAVALAEDAVELVPARVQPLWLLGMQLYDRQHIYLSMACRNPRRGLMCEPPAIKRIDFYCHSDLSLAGFIVAAAPHAQKKCQVAGCGYGVTCHVRTFLHGCSRITLSIATLPSSDALPGEERGQVWTWLRPKGVRHQASNSKQVRRLPLSQATACMSFGMFLSLCFCAPGLEVFGSPLHASFVRYFGLGRTVMCLHQDGIHPSAVAMPRIRVSYSLNAQLMWLKQEAAELCQESNEAFDVLESALQNHPYFRTQAAAAAASPLSAGQQLQQQRSPPAGLDAAPAAAAAYTAVGDGSGSSTPSSTTFDGHMSASAADAAAGSSSSGPLLVSMSAMLSAVRKDRISFMDKVAEAVQHATPETPTRESAGGMMWDEQLMSGILELNRLRRSLAITSLTWAAALQEPSFFAQMLAASSSAAVTAAVAAAAAAAAPPGSPMAVAVAVAAAAAAAAGLAAGGESNSGSTHGGSMFHLPPAVAAQRMGISDGQEGDPLGPAVGVSVPILPNMGPIAVQAVANLVAHEAATSTSGGLLEGSQSVMMAVTQCATEAAAAAASNGSSGCGSSAVTPGAAAAPVEVLGTGRDAAAAAAAGRFVLHSRSSSLGGGSLPSSPRAAAAAAGSGSSPGKAAGQLLAAVGRRLTSSLSVGASSSRTIGTGQPSSPSSTSGGSSSYIAERGKQLSLQHHRTASGAGSTGAAAAAAAAGAGSASGDEASSEDGEVAHDRFVAWMTSHEIMNAYDTDDMSDYFPEQLPDWDEPGAAAATATAGSSAAGTSSSTPAAAAGVAQQRLDGAAQQQHQQPPTPPATPELPGRAASGASGAGDDAGTSNSAAPSADGALIGTPRQQLSSHARALSVEAAAAASLGGVVGAAAAAGAHRRAESAEVAGAASHQRAGSVETTGYDNSRQQQQQQQQGSGIPAGLRAIRTGGGGSTGFAGPAAAARSGSTGGSAAVGAGLSSSSLGLQQIARVALPGRTLMPAGINDTVVPIFDSEPTSIAAYYLSSRSYQLQLNAAMRQILHDERRPAGQLQQQQQGRQQQQQQTAGSSGGSDGMAAAGAAAAAAVHHHHSRSASQEAFNNRSFAEAAADSAAAAAAAAEQLAVAAAAVAQEQRVAAGNGTAATPAPADSSCRSNATQASAPKQQHRSQLSGDFAASNNQQQRQPDWLALLLSPEPLHVKHAFEDESPGMPWLRARFSVTAYFAPQFAELRRRCIAGGEAAYITSLCRCRKWASRGGKSNAYFAKTRDDRFIVKSLSKPEKASFLEFAPAYFQHMARAAASGKPTTLAKVAGVYSITIRTQGGAPAAAAPGPGGQGGPFRDGSIDVLVMENIFYDRQISRIYDLKGSERSRFNADAAANPQDAGAVHLDDNLRRSNLQAPLLVEQGLLRSMEHALWRDTTFLAGLGVMDYSLLVGVDREHNQLVVAIIDFIRTYTWDKQLETWVKASGILGGSGKEPTIVSPKQYMRRFRAAISSYFTVVPDGHEVELPLDPDAA